MGTLNTRGMQHHAVGMLIFCRDEGKYRAILEEKLAGGLPSSRIMTLNTHWSGLDQNIFRCFDWHSWRKQLNIFDYLRRDSMFDFYSCFPSSGSCRKLFCKEESTKDSRSRCRKTSKHAPEHLETVVLKSIDSWELNKTGWQIFLFFFVKRFRKYLSLYFLTIMHNLMFVYYMKFK